MSRSLIRTTEGFRAMAPLRPSGRHRPHGRRRGGHRAQRRGREFRLALLPGVAHGGRTAPRGGFGPHEGRAAVADAGRPVAAGRGRPCRDALRRAGRAAAPRPVQGLGHLCFGAGGHGRGGGADRSAQRAAAGRMDAGEGLGLRDSARRPRRGGRLRRAAERRAALRRVGRYAQSGGHERHGALSEHLRLAPGARRERGGDRRHHARRGLFSTWPRR